MRRQARASSASLAQTRPSLDATTPCEQAFDAKSLAAAATRGGLLVVIPLPRSDAKLHARGAISADLDVSIAIKSSALIDTETTTIRLPPAHIATHAAPTDLTTNAGDVLRGA
jgi:hypothetical protein